MWTSSQDGAPSATRPETTLATGDGRVRTVAVVAHTSVRGGAEIMLERVATAVDGVGLWVVIGEPGELVERLVRARVQVDVVPLSAGARRLHRSQLIGWRGIVGFGAGIRGVWGLWRWLGRQRPDVVVAWTLKAGLVAIPAAAVRRVPLIWVQHDHLDQFPRTARWVIRHGLIERVAGIIANSAFAARSLNRTDRVRVVNPPGLARVPARPRDRERPDGLRIVMVGRIARWKGQHIAIEAFAKAVATDPRFETAHLRLVGAPLFGEADYEAELIDLVASLGLSERVQFIGQVPDASVELALADIAVHASIEPEAWGQVVLEAMQCGLAVVASDSGGPSEQIVDGETGILVGPGDGAALAAALVELADADVRERLGRAAAAATSGRSPARAAGELIAAVSELAGWTLPPDGGGRSA